MLIVFVICLLGIALLLFWKVPIEGMPTNFETLKKAVDLTLSESSMKPDSVYKLLEEEEDTDWLVAPRIAAFCVIMLTFLVILIFYEAAVVCAFHMRLGIK